MKLNWKIIENIDCHNIEDEFFKIVGNKRLAQILINRKIDTISKLNKFLNPDNLFAFDYDVFEDIKKVLLRIDSAINNNEKIIIYGDFDCDGITSTAVLYKILKELNANVDYYIPNRIDESHGLNTKALVKLLSKEKAKLIITCDCASSDIACARFVKSFNCDLIITDHHIGKKELPEAYAILNPKIEGSLKENLSLEQIESLNELSGVGVVFKLAYALIKKYKKSQAIIDDLLVLVTIGTIADVVPLLNENRFFVKNGFNLVAYSNMGIKTLVDSVSYSNHKSLTSDFIAYQIIPKINAEGRLMSIKEAFTLLTSYNQDEINYAIMTLTSLNEQRQSLCNQMFIEANKMLENETLENNDAIILYNPNWHAGIVGIVASKLVEKYNRPCLLFTYDKARNLYRASGRSVDEVDIHELIKTQSEFLEFYGGHKGAIGCAFSNKKITFEKLKTNLNNVINEMTKELQYNKYVYIDSVLDFEDLTIDFVKNLSKLEPFGEGNRPPLFLLQDVVLKDKKTIGANNNHLKCYICDNKYNNVFECIFWNRKDISANINSIIDLVFVPKISSFNGETKIQLEIHDIDCKKKAIQDNCSCQKRTLRDILKTACGMVVYASRHKNGEVDLNIIAHKLAVSASFVDMFLHILNDIKMIEIKKQNRNLIEYQFLGSKEMNTIVNHKQFANLNIEFQKINNGRELETVL